MRLYPAFAGGLAWPVQPNLVVTLRLILLADEFQGVPERRNRSLERHLDIAPLHSKLVNRSLQLFAVYLAFLKQQVGPSLGFSDNNRGFPLGILPNLVRDLLDG